MGIKTVQDTSLTSVANAIRVKAEISGTLEFPDDFVSAIQNISTGITPTGTLTITQNGTYDVTDYASADVNVSGGGDVLKDLIEREITSLTIPDEITKIGTNAFRGCSDLASITIPNTVQTIGSNAFQDCTSLTSIKFPSGISAVTAGVCSGCTNLTSIEIPSSVTSIASSAFYNCTHLTSITCRAIYPPTVSSNAFKSVPADANIYVPASSVEAYKAASYWSARAAYIQAIPA